MIEYLTANWQQNIALIGLDHDLELLYGDDHQLIDPGTGMEVAEWLGATCSTNLSSVDSYIELTSRQSNAGSDTGGKIGKHTVFVRMRVRPYDDLAWIPEWFQIAHRAILDHATK